MPEKKLTNQQILDRTKAKSYIMLPQDHIVKVVSQLNAEQQKKCFGNEKTLKPLNPVQAAGILTVVEGLDKIDPRPISKIPIDDQRKIIKEQSAKNDAVKKFLEENGYWEQSQILKETTVAGDFSPSGLWSVIDDMIADMDFSRPKE